MDEFYIKKYNNIKTIETKIKKTNFFFTEPKSKNLNNQVMNLLWKEKFGKMLGDSSFPFMFMSYHYQDNKWKWFCEEQYQKINICTRNPIDFFLVELRSIINLVKLSKKNIVILPIHLNLTLYRRNSEIIHANTIILDFSKKSIYIFEPRGVTNNLVNNISSIFTQDWNNITKKLGWNFKGYFLSKFNYQIYDKTYCYLWTSWLENLILLNHNKNIKTIKYYLEDNYSFTRHLLKNIIIMDSYLEYIYQGGLVLR